jgi:predicted protein tyrosine phosphatase
MIYMKLLFVCTNASMRSPTAAELFARKGHVTRAAGISPTAVHTVSQKDLDWADRVLCMEEEHKIYLEQNFRVGEVEVLNVPDAFPRDDPELIRMLEEKVRV